ncbi:MAG: SsrA-binding protein SmpB [Bacilli bacterium]|nr:SsrA-binding protein SmpB [Bacilli bacterium]
MKRDDGIKIITTNRKAGFNYFLSDFTECGIVLLGTEIKSLRRHSCNIGDAYIVFRSHEAEIVNMHINPYEEGNIFNHDPLRSRKLLMHKKEITWFEEKIKKGGYTVVPTKIYFYRGRAKVEIALAKGKKLYDKRETIKQRDVERDLRKNGGNY